jgi:putative FmdB family regulatory protein
VPTYQYTCTECGEPVEAVQKFTDAPLTVCAACGGRLRKVFSPVGIVFKGSGFYRTDSRNGSASKDAATKDKPSGDSPATAASSESASNGNGSGDKKDGKKSGDSVSSPAKSSSSSSSEKVA